MFPLVNSYNPPWINNLPNDMLFEIISYLDSTVLRINEICKRWRDLPSKEWPYKSIFYRELVFFGPGEWEEYFGKPVTVLEIESYKQVVREAFTFASKWPKEWDKKMVWLQPKEILQEQLVKEPAQILITPRKIGELVAAKLGGNYDPTGYGFFLTDAFREHGDKPVEESCWVYMTPDIIPGSRKEFEIPEEQAKDFGGEVPDLTLTVTGILLKRLVTGKRLFSDSPLTFTRCKERTRGRQLVVGGFDPGGLSVSLYAYGFGDGVAVLRRFKAIGT